MLIDKRTPCLRFCHSKLIYDKYVRDYCLQITSLIILHQMIANGLFSFLSVNIRDYLPWKRGGWLGGGGGLTKNAADIFLLERFQTEEI
jgi:hypothetical protein